MTESKVLSSDAENVNFLLNNLVDSVHGIVDAVVVSADGLLMAMSADLGRAAADQLAAVASGLTSLTDGAARCFGGGNVNQIVVELDGGYMLFLSISDGSALAVLADDTCDIGVASYQMTHLSKSAGQVLTPSLIMELQDALPRS